MADTLRSDVLALITNNNDTIVNIKNILVPITQCIDNPIIAQNVVDIVDIMTTDRDGNKKFDINDLKVMANDTFVIIHLVTILLLILTALPGLRITVDVTQSEMIVFKLIMFILLIVIPNKTKVNWNKEDKITLLDLSLLIFKTMQSYGIVKTVVGKIVSYAKTNKFCSCLSVKTDVIEDKVPDAKIELVKAINDAKHKQLTHEKIMELEKKIKQ